MDLVKIAKNGNRTVISLPKPTVPALLPDGNYDVPALRAFQKALSAYDRTLRAKLLAGYFVSTPPDDAAPGQVIYDGGFKYGNGVLVFDLHPNELVAVVARVLDSTRVVIERVDLTTNARQTLDELTSETVAHWLRFEASGKHVRFAVDGDTWRLHVPTRTKERLASTDFTQARPIDPLSNRIIVDASNRSRTRFVELAEEHLTVREERRVLLQRELLHPTRVCELAALAPSGKRLALYFRGVGARGDTTNEIEVWNVDDGSRVSVLPMTGLLPDDDTVLGLAIAFIEGDTRLLLAVRYGAERMFSIDVQEPVTPREHQLPVNRTPCQFLVRADGSDVLFVDGCGTLLMSLPDLTTTFESDVEDFARDRRAQYSDDGHWLATGSDHGRLVVRRAPA